MSNTATTKLRRSGDEGVGEWPKSYETAGGDLMIVVGPCRGDGYFCVVGPLDEKRTDQALRIAKRGDRRKQLTEAGFEVRP